MRLELLQCLVAIADAGTASGAARVLGISQPAVTRRLQTLERVVGEPLFERARRPWRSTPAGERLLAVARQTLRTTEAITQGFDRLPQGSASSGVQIGFGPTAAVLLGAPLARAALAHRVAGWQVAFHHAPSRQLIEQLLDGMLDLVLTDASDLARVAGIGVGPTYAFGIDLWVRPGHPADHGRPLSLAELFTFPLVGPNPAADVEAILRPILPGSGAITDALAIVSEDIEALAALVAESDAVLIAARPMVTRLPGALRLRSVALADPIVFSARVRMGVSRSRAVSPETLRWVSEGVEGALMGLGATRVD
ncbi:MAG: LysR family transcriptional regulator [Gemmatimonadaceae bacterium]